VNPEPDEGLTFNSINDISLSPNTIAKQCMRDYINKYTREAGGGQEEAWQKALTEFDPELYLRRSGLNKQWLIIYDHKGQIDVITIFKSGGFGRAFHYVKYNSILTSRGLQQLKKEQNAVAEKDIDDKIKDAGEEFGTELYHGARRRLISDGMTKMGGR